MPRPIPSSPKLLTLLLGLTAGLAGCLTAPPAPPTLSPTPTVGDGPQLRPVVSRWSEFRYWRGLTAPPAGWNEPDFDDSDWEIGYLFLGYGQDALVLSSFVDDLRESYRSVYLRHEVDLGASAGLYRELWFDGATSGGYAAFINGVEVAREALSAEAAFDEAALGDAPTLVRLDVPPGLLRPVGNVLAAQMHRTEPAPPEYVIYSQFLGSIDARQDPPRLVRGPYQQDLRADGMTLVFETSTAATALVELESDQGPRQVRLSPPARLHAVPFIGLPPSKLHRWRIRIGDQVVATGRFTTGPVGDEPFSFLVYGDTRTDSRVHAALVAQMKDEPADFVVHVGDFVWLGAADVPWDGFFTVADPLLRRMPLFPTLGNHEIWLDPLASQYTKLFVVPANGPPGQGKLAYSFRHGSSAFIVLNSSAEGATFDWGTQPAWLASHLGQLSADPTVRHIFVSLHVPLVGSSPYGVAPGAEGILAILANHRITLLLQGHDHLYERGQEGQVRYLTTGGGGGPLTPIDPARIRPGAQVLEADYHYVRIDVSGAAVRVLARRLDGTVLDDHRFVDE